MWKVKKFNLIFDYHVFGHFVRESKCTKKKYQHFINVFTGALPNSVLIWAQEWNVSPGFKVFQAKRMTRSTNLIPLLQGLPQKNNQQNSKIEWPAFLSLPDFSSAFSIIFRLNHYSSTFQWWYLFNYWLIASSEQRGLSNFGPPFTLA